MDNATRRGLLTRHRQSQFPGSILDVFKAHDQGIDLLGEFEQQQMQVAQTPQQQQQGLRPSHQAGNVNQSMTFPNVPPNTPFNTMGMKAPIDIKKFNEQGHLVKSYDSVPPGVQNLPTGPQRGTVIETPANMQSGGEVKKHQAGAFLAAGIGIGKAVIKTAKQRIADNIYPVGYMANSGSITPFERLYSTVIKNEPEPGSKKHSDQEGNGRTKHNMLERQNIIAYDTYSNSDPGYHDSKTKASSDAINVLGNYTIDKGEDSRGKYISYYDKWDLDPFPGNTKLSSTIQKGIGIKAPEMYGRIYYDPKTGAPIGGKKDIPSWDSKYLKEEGSSVASKTKTNMQGGGVIPGMEQYAQYNNLNPELAAAVASRPQNNDRLTSSTDAQMRQFNNRGEQTRVNNAQTNMSNRLSTAGSNAYQFHKDKPLDALGMDLAIAGQLPIVGEVADLANAGISGARGIYNTAVGDTAKAKEQFTLAGLSAASAIPFAGNAVGAVRIAKAGHNISHKAHTLEKGVIGAKAFKASAYESKQTGGFKGSDLASAMKVGAGAAITSTVGRGISALAKNRNLDKDAFAQWKAGQDRAHQAMLGMDYDEYCLTGDCPENPFQGDPPNFKDWRNHDYFSASQTNARPVGRLVQGFEDKPLQGKSILKQGVRDGIVTGALTYGTNKLLDNTRFGRNVKRNFNVKVGWNGRRQAGGELNKMQLGGAIEEEKAKTITLFKKQKARTLRDAMGYRENPDGSRSTHLMTSGDNYAWPSIYPDSPGNYKEQIFDEALDRGEMFEFKNEKRADKFARGNWKTRRWEKKAEMQTGGVRKLQAGTPPSFGIDSELLKAGVAGTESSNGVNMMNPGSTATGLYGQLFSEVKDSYPGTRKEFSTNIAAQDSIFDKRLYEGLNNEKSMMNNLEYMYKNYPDQIAKKGYSAEQLAGIINMLGRQGTREYLGYVVRDKKDLAAVFPDKYGPSVPKEKKNKTPDEYAKTMQSWIDKYEKDNCPGGECEETTQTQKYFKLRK